MITGLAIYDITIQAMVIYCQVARIINKETIDLRL